jgi:hypothetical protein
MSAQPSEIIGRDDEGRQARRQARSWDIVIPRRLMDSWTSGTAQVGRRSSGGDENQVLAGDAMSLARISVTVAAGLATAVTAGHAVATNTSSAAPALASSLGRLISRIRSVIRHRPVLGRSQRSDPHFSTYTIGVFRRSRARMAQLGPRRAAKAWCAVPMSNMPLQLTRACQLSVDGQRAGAARPLR